MLKKIIFAAALAIVAEASMANPVPYVGIGTGVTTNTANVNVINGDFTGGSFRGMPLNVLLGYGGCFYQDFYLAGELNATLATAEINDNKGLKTSYSYGASILPGVMLTDHTVAFARLGILRSRFTTANASSNGGQVGVGLQSSLMQNIDVRVEYDYVSYRSVNNTVNSRSVSVSPRSDQFAASLIYKFD